MLLRSALPVFFFDYFLSILSGFTITISFLRFHGHLAVSTALISHHTVVFQLRVCICSSAITLPHAFAGQLFFSSLCLSPFANLLHPLCSPRSRVTRASLYGAPWDVSAISRSLISESSSWQRTKLREAQAQGPTSINETSHAHSLRRTPSATVGSPVGSATVGRPQQNTRGWVCEEMSLITQG